MCDNILYHTCIHISNDLPYTFYCRRHREGSCSPEDRDEEEMLIEDDDDLESSDADRPVMNAHMAAMVLTSLSCSPVSPGSFHPVPPDKGKILHVI